MQSLETREGRLILLSVPVGDALLTPSTVSNLIPVLFIYNTFIVLFTMNRIATFVESNYGFLYPECFLAGKQFHSFPSEIICNEFH